MGIVSRLAQAWTEGIAPSACLECGAWAAGPHTPICSACCGQLPWWRAIDGCPRCGFAGGALPAVVDFERPDVPGIPPVADAASTRSIAPDAPCPGCYVEGSALDRSQTLLRYVDSPRVWIPHFKHHQSPFGPPLGSRLAVGFFAFELARLLAKRIGEGRLQAPDLILPVPLHARRRRLRGFNQSQWIAVRLGRLLGIPVSSRTLVRVRDTPAQAFLDASARRRNLRRAFCLTAGTALPERVWLVDDVLTTGATLESAAETLLARDVDQVVAITLAATPPRPWPRRAPARSKAAVS